ERVWADPLPPIKVTYKNLARAYFRVYRADFVSRIGGPNRWRPEQLNHDEQLALLRQKPVLEFQHDLPLTADYQLRTESLPAPAGSRAARSSWSSTTAGNSPPPTTTTCTARRSRTPRTSRRFTSPTGHSTGQGRPSSSRASASGSSTAPTSTR